MKTMIPIICPDCGKERYMTLGDYNRGRRKTKQCLYCYNHTPRMASGDYKPVIHEGYVLVYRPYNHRANNRGYVKRAVIVLEEASSRNLESHEFIHHVNGKKDDDRLENLQIFSNSEHVKLHAKQRVWLRNKKGQFASHQLRFIACGKGN